MATYRQRYLFLLLIALLFSGGLSAQNRKSATISGYVKDEANGEDIIGATVYLKGTNNGASSNAYGYYSLPLQAGSYRIVASFPGYQPQEFEINLTADRRIDIALKPAENRMEEIVIISGRNANVTKPEMGTAKLTAQTIKSIPALMGEVDVLKAIQLLPGVQSTSEGSSGFSVRGGSYDQNLILLDEASVYNASHLMGFFSVFNNDAIKDVKLYKGDIPASYGGRLSSLVDIRTRDGNSQEFAGAGGIGTISSRLTLEGPLKKDTASFIVSARRTYADLFLLLSSDEDLRNTSLYFYDMNAKVNWRINRNNRIFLAGYFGRDKMKNPFAGMSFGNRTVTLRWNHLFSPNLFSNFTAVGGFYDYYLKNTMNDQMAVDWGSRMQHWGVKADFSYRINAGNDIQFGASSTFHRFLPCNAGGINNSQVSRLVLPNEYALENAVYISNETALTDKLRLKYGVRYTVFSNLGNGHMQYKLEDYRKTADSTAYPSGKIYHSQARIEPRLGMVYAFNNRHSVKASYSRTAQFIQLASNSASGSPIDVWFQASPNVKPQISDQYAAGYFRNFSGNAYEASVELYYRNLRDVIDFKDHAQLLMNEHLEEDLRFGRGKSYGFECMLRKNEGALNGWISYTYSIARRQIEQINDGKWYRSPFDKPNNISVVVNYDIGAKWSFSANWVYATGKPVTYPVGRYWIEGNYVPIYSGRNEYRYPDYHRLDLSATRKFRKGKWLQSELNFSLYNAYGRKNPWIIQFRQEKEMPNVSYAEMIYLFSMVPSVTWNFNF